MPLGVEIIIADDGSNGETSIVVEQFKNKMQANLFHIWQPDNGFQAAKIRNKAIARARSEYIVL